MDYRTYLGCDLFSPASFLTVGTSHAKRWVSLGRGRRDSYSHRARCLAVWCLLWLMSAALCADRQESALTFAIGIACPSPLLLYDRQCKWYPHLSRYEQLSAPIPPTGAFFAADRDQHKKLPRVERSGASSIEQQRRAVDCSSPSLCPSLAKSSKADW